MTGAAEDLARTGQALLALGERIGAAGELPRRPRDYVPSTRKLTDDAAVSAWMARERSVVSAVVASGIQLLDLSEVKALYEREWERIAAVVRRIIESTIERKTSADDLYVEACLESWIVLFGDEPDAHEADRRTRRIAEAISDRLAGAGDDAGVDLRPAGGLVRVHHITLQLDRPAGEIKTIRDLLLSWQRSHQAEVRARQGWIDGLGLVASTWLEPEVSLRVPSAALDGGGLAAITGYRQRLEARDPLGEQYRDMQEAREGNRPVLDRVAMERGCGYLSKLGGRTLTVPVSADTLDWAEHRASLLDALGDLDGTFNTVADAAMFLEIEDLPDDMQHGRLLRIVQPFMPLVAGILAGIDPARPGLDRFEMLGSRFRGFSVDGRRLRTKAQWHGLACTADSVSRRPWCLRIHNVVDASAIPLLKRVPGIQCISGPAVAAALSAPIVGGESGPRAGRR